MDQVISGYMPPVLVYVSDIGKVKHHTANIPWKGLIQIFFNQGIAAVTVGNAGYRIRRYGKIQFSIVLFKCGKQAEVHKDEQKA